MKSLIHLESIERRIYLVRGQKVMLDSDLAQLYGVETRALIQAVKRNSKRFPLDFTFQLTEKEAAALRSQFVISKIGRGGRRYLPYVFTEHGVSMLSSVLNSERAIQVNIAIMRAFVRVREVLATHRDLAKRLERVEKQLAGHRAVLGKQAREIGAIFEALRRLIEPPVKPKRRIGFQPHKK